MRNEHTQRTLPFWKVYTYGLGEFGFNFFLVFISYHLMFFLTDVAKFPTATAAFLYTLVQWLESISLLFSGYIIDRSRLPGGKYRPWLLIGSFACMIGMVLFFTKWNLGSPIYAVVFPLCYLIAYWGYNFMWVGYRSIMGFIGKNQTDTVSLTTAASQMGTVSMLVFSVLGGSILYGFTDISTGYTVSALLYGGLMVLSMVVVFFLCKPYDKFDRNRDYGKSYNYLTYKDVAKSLKGPMIPFFIAFVLRSSIQMLIPALITYHFTHMIGNPNGTQIYLVLYTVAQMVGLFFVSPVTAKLGKKNTFIISSACTLVLLCLAWFFRTQLVPFLVIMSLNAFVTIFGASLLPAFLTDIADYNEYELGLNTRSTTVSIGATTITVASILGGGIAAYGLSFIGYDSSLAVQSATVINSITNFMLFGGALFALGSMIPMFFYKLGNKTMDKVYEKRAAQQQDNPVEF